MQFIGREKELKILENEYKKKGSSFVAVYGRRRIGKTKLVDHFINSNNLFSFSITGAYNAKLESHLENFSNKIHLSFGSEKINIKNWDSAFQSLQYNIINSKIDKNLKFTIFFDELPWLAELKENGFKSALSLFWNDFASKRNDIFLVVCGSATSWIIDNILEDKGSLSNRITAIIHLHSFNLNETKLFLDSQGHKRLSNKIILDIYIILGGVAHYLKLLSPKESLVQNMQRMFFSPNGILRTEYHHLFASLFKKYKTHEIIIKNLSLTWNGITLAQLAKKKGLQLGSSLQKALKELEESGFLVKRRRYNQKIRDTLYCVKDPFIFFYTKWVNQTAMVDIIQNTNYFQKIFSSHSYKVWSGFAFENVCHEHIYEIKKALSIGGIITNSYYWNLKAENKEETGAQIDILLKRDDNVINLIECKYYNSEFIISKEYAKKLQNKIDSFYKNTLYKGSINTTLISVYGIKNNEYYDELITNDILIDELF